MNVPQAAWDVSTFAVGFTARGRDRGRVHGVNGFTRESKVQYYVKTFFDLAQRPLPAARTALMVWQDAIDEAAAGATR
jgi:hypothetical protein